LQTQIDRKYTERTYLEQWCTHKVLLESYDLIKAYSCSNFWIHELFFPLFPMVCLKKNCYQMKTTECVNFYLHGGYFYESKDVDIDVSYMCTQLDFKNSSSIFFNQLSQIFTKSKWNNSLKMDFLFFESEIWYVDWGGVKQ
jgi:hypothetical protein